MTADHTTPTQAELGRAASWFCSSEPQQKAADMLCAHREWLLEQFEALAETFDSAAEACAAEGNDAEAYERGQRAAYMGDARDVRRLIAKLRKT